MKNLDLEVASGEFLVILGPSGAGKTTTLRLIAGLEVADSGNIKIDGVDCTNFTPSMRDVAFVFQQYSLYPHLSVYENLAFPLRSPLRQYSESEINNRITNISKMLQIEDKLKNAATKLSGGQMQRVAIGRALVRNPSLYLMDEPLSSLDARLRNDLRIELKRIQEELGATFIYVTHDQTEALTLATRIGVLENGKLIQIDTPNKIYTNPVNASVASRLGSPRINLLPASCLPQLLLDQRVASIGVRAENIKINSKNFNNGIFNLPARVSRMEQLSDQFLMHLRIEKSEIDLICLTDPNHGFSINESVYVEINNYFGFNSDGLTIINI